LLLLKNSLTNLTIHANTHGINLDSILKPVIPWYIGLIIRTEQWI